MSTTLTIYIVGDFKSGAADGLAEFNYQNVKLLEDTFHFEFIEFDDDQPVGYSNLENRGGINVHRFGAQGLRALSLPPDFREWLRKVNRESVLFHLSHIWNIKNYLIARDLVSLKIPYLITPHDSYVYGPIYNKGKSFFKRLYRKVFVEIFDKYVLDHARQVHALTSQCVPALQLITSSSIRVVGNQVKDIQIPLDMSNIKPKVCFIGRMSVVQKGIDLALEAFAKFKKDSKFPDTIFTLIGPANAEQSEACTSLCERLGLKIGTDVVFVGKVVEDERNCMLAESKVYMQLSKYEGFGLSIAQALSAFKPVIVSAAVPISSEIKSYGAGFVVNNMIEAAEALDKIFSMSPNSYKDMALNARSCYEKEFAPGVIKPKLIDLYSSVSK